MVSSPKQTNVSATRKQIRISLWYIFHVSSPLERNAKPLPTNSMQFETAADNRGIRKGKVVGEKQPREKSGFSISLPPSQIYGKEERRTPLHIFHCIQWECSNNIRWMYDPSPLLILNNSCFTNDPEIWREISNWIPRYLFFQGYEKII